jgi:hypothetical protein
MAWTKALRFFLLTKILTGKKNIPQEIEYGRRWGPYSSAQTSQAHPGERVSIDGEMLRVDGGRGGVFKAGGRVGHDAFTRTRMRPLGWMVTCLV